VGPGWGAIKMEEFLRPAAVKANVRMFEGDRGFAGADLAGKANLGGQSNGGRGRFG